MQVSRQVGISHYHFINRVLYLVRVEYATSWRVELAHAQTQTHRAASTRAPLPINFLNQLSWRDQPLSSRFLRMKFLVAVLSLAFLPALLNAQSEGDVRLVGAIPARKGGGRLEIYWRSKWSTVCRNTASAMLGGANAACRQLGFESVIRMFSYGSSKKIGFNVTAADEDTPIALTSTGCSDSYARHFLRCEYTSPVPSWCSHDDDVILICSTTSLWLHPYQTEVRLAPSTSPPSSGVLEIYISDKWGNVCDEFDKGAADSACRQMGYTGASSYLASSSSNSSTVWLSGVKCGSTDRSCSCVNSCFNGRAPSKPASCPGQSYISITCTFNVTTASSFPAGSESDCSNYQGTCNNNAGGGGGGGATAAVVGGVVASVVVVLIITVSVIAAVVAYYVVSSKRKGYYSIND